MIIALFPNEKKKQSFEIATTIREFLEAQGITVVAEDENVSARAEDSLRSTATGDVHAESITMPMGKK